jgi:hypothetical protein
MTATVKRACKDLLPPYNMDLLMMIKTPAPITFATPIRIKSVRDRVPILPVMYTPRIF